MGFLQSRQPMPADRQPACPQYLQDVTTVAPAGTGVLLGTRYNGLWYAGPAQPAVPALYLPTTWR